VRFRRPPGAGEAEAGPSQMLGVARALKGLEEMRKVTSRDADPLIDDPHDELTRLPLDGNRDPPGRRRVLDRVREQVAQDLPHEIRVDEDRPATVHAHLDWVAGRNVGALEDLATEPFDIGRNEGTRQTLPLGAVDRQQLALLSDVRPPRSFFWSDGPRVSATLTLSVYFHGTDDEIDAVGDGYLLNEATGTRATASTSGQEARLWSADGALLATTEQLCWFR